ncbi:hypothetical protein SAMN03080599_03111 [Acidaminobacter hydrogenoformans DSM 2784]|uniref:Uncharacterized protein n=1 Tax=Acidaminobacter hydrogenoformans DSM 2784 TaxID=1120920 RepID=A0A1G5S6B5_9FIRM|nr:hypothetical protein SAMN03080599_03111 [Acidaminobacter hydrogenoformans DSM 2784]
MFGWGQAPLVGDSPQPEVPVPNQRWPLNTFCKKKKTAQVLRHLPCYSDLVDQALGLKELLRDFSLVGAKVVDLVIHLLHFFI